MLGFLLAGIALSSQAASFDCQRASTPRERAVCADAELSALDDRLAQAYRAAIERAGPARRVIAHWQKAWLYAGDVESCADDRDCLRGSYSRRVELLSKVLPAADPASAWTGRYERRETSARLADGAELLLVALEGGQLVVIGDASMAFGSTVNAGHMEGQARIAGKHADFNHDGCTARLERSGRDVTVLSESGCGGANVSFVGVYRRR